MDIILRNPGDDAGRMLALAQRFPEDSVNRGLVGYVLNTGPKILCYYTRTGNIVVMRNERRKP